MVSKPVRRMLMLLMLVGGPVVGWFIKGDRGLLLGAAVGALAVVWFALEQRKIL